MPAIQEKKTIRRLQGVAIIPDIQNNHKNYEKIIIIGCPSITQTAHQINLLQQAGAEIIALSRRWHYRYSHIKCFRNRMLYPHLAEIKPPIPEIIYMKVYRCILDYYFKIISLLGLFVMLYYTIKPHPATTTDFHNHALFDES